MAMTLNKLPISSALASRVRSCRIDTDAVGSDHQPVWVDMDL